MEKLDTPGFGHFKAEKKYLFSLQNNKDQIP
jgi:hypothetical protein